MLFAGGSHVCGGWSSAGARFTGAAAADAGGGEDLADAFVPEWAHAASIVTAANSIV